MSLYYCSRTPKGEEPGPHNCSINFTKGAGAMESVSILECVEEVSYDKVSNVQLVTLCIDRDATTAALCRHKKSERKTDVGQLPLDIEEFEIVLDLNHWVKALAKRFFQMSRAKKSVSRLDGFDAHRLKRDCSAAAHQADMSTLITFKAAFLPIAPHHFNIHVSCGDWCTNSTSESSKGKYRCAELWEKEYKAVTAVIEEFTTPKELKLIQHDLSTNPNEAMNKANCRRAPKDLFWAGTDSYKYRCAVTVGQLSVGHQQYYERVFSSIGITVNPTTNAMFDRLDRIDVINRKRKQSFEYKLKRSQTSNANWRGNLLGVRMDLAAGKGYGDKAAIVAGPMAGTSDIKQISKYRVRTPKFGIHILPWVLESQCIST